jgi:type II secretory pathway pseudopilin PulG
MSRARQEGGFTMIAAILGTSLIAMLALVAVAAVNGDVHLTQNDLARKKAFDAAKAGIDDYAFHLNADNTYWTHCTEVPKPNAVNQQGSTTNRRSVPGNTGAEYAIELIPATGQASCNPASSTTATTSMLESSGALAGSFRIRSNGYSEKSKVSIVATFKRASFLDYVYFTQLETSDPVTYGYANPSEALTGAYSQCELTYEQGRYEDPIPGTYDPKTREWDYCNKISFVSGDTIKGPLHTNDALAICGTPTFGRSAADKISVSSSSPGWFSTCNGSKPTFTGTYETSSAVLTPPPTNSKLATIAEPAFKYTGQVRICLSGATMTVGTGGTCTGKYSGAIPANGVIYVANGVCSTPYTPFNTTYPETSTCGNVYVSGSYSGQLTIAAENDIVVNGNLKKSAGSGMLGLVANNFVRVYHPCSGGENLAGSLENLTINAAILAINHSFIVDNYKCGNQLGNLNVVGAIAQKFRGPVGTTGGTGYLKNYEYDDRLRYVEPPSFIDPVQAKWIVGRETNG